MLPDSPSLEVRDHSLPTAYFGGTPVLDDDTLGIDGEAFDAADEAEDGGPEIVGVSSLQEEEILHALYKDLERGERAKAVLAEAEMRKVIEFNQQIEHHAVDGLGVLAARIPLSVFLAWTAREGHEFWHDPKNLDYFEKRANGTGNPGFRVKTTMKPTVVVERKLSSATASVTNHGVNSAAGVATSAPAVTAPKRSRGGRWAKN